MLPKLVLFDLDDTLFDHLGTVERALAETSRRYPVLAAVPLSVLVAENQRMLEELHARVCTGELDMSVARIQRLQRLFEFCGGSCTQAQAEEVAAGYRVAYQKNRHAVDGAHDLLEYLRGKTRIGIVSNNMTAEQEEKLRAIGLDAFIDFMVTSEDAGILKPESGIYLRALDVAGVAASEAVFIGDAWENDVVGPQTVGIKAMWLSRGRPTPEGVKPFAVVGELRQVPIVFENLGVS